jgi:hypothetical protein
MATNRTRSRATASNGSGAASPIAGARATGITAAKAARGARAPALTAGATVAGLAGGFALGSWKASKTRPGTAKLARAVAQLAKELGSLTSEVASTGDDARELRQLLKQANRRSPVEVLLDGLTHRRGAHRNES